jgi:hypothetical protein
MLHLGDKRQAAEMMSGKPASEKAMTDRRSRREFMGLTTAGAAGILTRPWLGPRPSR